MPLVWLTCDGVVYLKFRDRQLFREPNRQNTFHGAETLDLLAVPPIRYLGVQEANNCISDYVIPAVGEYMFVGQLMCCSTGF